MCSLRRHSRGSPESRRLRRASTRQSRHGLPAQSASEGGRFLLQTRTGSDASGLRQEHRDLHDMETFDSATTTIARLPPSGLLGPRVCARPRVDTENRRTRAQFCSTISLISGADGHGGDRPPRQLETVCARDYDRPLQATDLVPLQTSVDARLLHQQPQNQSLWPFDQLAYNKTFHSIAARANVAFLGVKPYSPRHVGASHDALTRDIILSQINARVRCGGVQRVAMLDPATVAYGQTIEMSLPTSVFAVRVQTMFAELQTTPHAP